jgi:hypothetical protein
VAYTVAEAEVRVLPNADNFGEDLKAEILPKADSIGREAGDRIGKGIQERVRLALKDLPDAKVGVDLDQAKLDTELAELRAKLDAAGDGAGRSMGQKIGQGAADGARGGSPLIMAAIAGGLIAGGPLVIAAAGTVMGGIAAAIVHSAPEIEGATTSLLNAFNLDFKQAAEITIPYFVQALGTIKDSAAGLADQAAPAFAALDKPIQSLTQGVVSLATNAMPGLVSTVTQGLPVFQGLQSFLGSVGTGLSSMLTTLTSHAGAMGSTLASLGDIIGTLLSALGTLASEGAELGQAVLPALATVLGVLNTVLQAIAPVLPSIALGFAGWKVAGLLAPMLGSLATSLEDVGAKAMVSVAGMTGIEGAGIAAGTGFEVAANGARGLEAAMGPIGWVLLAIGLAVPALVSAFHSEDATQKQVKASAEAMTQALQQSKGAIDDNVRATAALQAQKNGLFDWAQKWGVSTSTVVDAMLGQQGAMETVASGAHAYADAQSRAADANLYSTDGTFELAGGYQKQAAASDAALGSLTNLAGGVKGEIANQNALTTAINGSLTPAQVNAQRLQAIANTASAASSQITLLKGALDALTGKAVTMDEAQIAVTQAVQAATTAVQGQTGALKVVNGELDLHTQKGAAAGQALIGLAGAQHQEIAAMEAQGKGTDAVNAKADEMRAQFIKTAQQMGFNAADAKTLADRYLGIPGAVHTEVTADTSQAFQATQALIDRINRMSATITVRASSDVGVSAATQATGHLSKPGAAIGGIAMRAFADGGVYTPMPGGIADVVAPQTYRVIGDNLTSDEAYIPINDSARSLSILAQTAHRMGYGLSQAAPAPAQAGPMTVVAQFGSETIEAKAVQVVSGTLAGMQAAAHYGRRRA